MTSHPAISPPPLETGDHLTRAEFEKRYAADPQIKRAELIEGVVYVASPLRFAPHAEPHAKIMIWLGIYQIATPDLRLGDNPTVRLDGDNEPQPDAVLIIDPSAGGQTSLSEDGYLTGAPELVVEIAASSTSSDLHLKKHVYCRNGVREYLVWQIFENRLDWFSLEQGDYVPLEADDDGILRSRIFPGLWLATGALLNNDMAKVLEVVQQGIASPEYQRMI